MRLRAGEAGQRRRPPWRLLPQNVWSGRASQEVFVDLSVVRSCINVSGLRLEHVLRATMDISAPAFSLAGRPQVGHLGYQCSQAPGRPSSISSHSLADLGGNRLCCYVIAGSLSVQFLCSCHEAVPSSRPALVPGHRAQGPSRLAIAVDSPLARHFQATP